MYLLRESLPFISKMFKSYSAAESISLIEFISLIIRFELNKRLAVEKEYRLTCQDVFDRLKGITISSIKGKWVLNAMSKEQSRLLSVIGVKIPTNSEINECIRDYF